MSLGTQGINTFARAIPLLVAACTRSKSVDGEAHSELPRRLPTPAAESAGSTEGDEKKPTEHYRCEKRWEAREYSAVIERHDDVNWFCSPWIELETPERLAILENDPGPMEEAKRWALLVGDVRLDVRIDPNWSDFVAEGWRKPEIETVVYPEVFGRSVRRVVGERVRRETDLIFANAPRLRVHFRYLDEFSRISSVDAMIDRAHVPMCDNKSDCAYCK